MSGNSTDYVTSSSNTLRHYVSVTKLYIYEYICTFMNVYIGSRGQFSCWNQCNQMVQDRNNNFYQLTTNTLSYYFQSKWYQFCYIDHRVRRISEHSTCTWRPLFLCMSPGASCHFPAATKKNCATGEMSLCTILVTIRSGSWASSSFKPILFFNPTVQIP